MEWKTVLAYITGTVDQELLMRNDYLVAENRILRNQITGRIRLTNGERITLATLGKQLGKKALADVVSVVKPETLLAWHRKLIAKKFESSMSPRAPGRPPIAQAIEDLVVRFAKENRQWGYTRIIGALKHVGYTVSHQTVGNILKRHNLLPAPTRRKTTTWREFIRAHLDILVATDFFTAEVWTKSGLVTYYILFYIQVRTRTVHLAGLTPHPNEAWMKQITRNSTMPEWGFLTQGQYLIHDRDAKFCSSWQEILDAAGVTPIKLPPRSPNLNAHAERWVRSVKEEALSQLILFGEGALRKVLQEYVTHYHHERPHQGKGNELLLPKPRKADWRTHPIRSHKRLGGLLKYYAREAA